MTTHTPGPWTANQDEGWQGIVFKGDTSIAQAYGGYDDPEVQANARLIAAAPEMYAALKALFEHCAMVHKHWGEGSNQKQADEAIAAAIAAIQKAEGE